MRALLLLVLAAVPAAADVIGTGHTPMINALLQQERREQKRRLGNPSSPRTISSHTGVLLIKKSDGPSVIVKPEDPAPTVNAGDEVEVQSGECVLTFKNSLGKVYSEVKAAAGASFSVSLDGRSIEVSEGSVVVTSGGKVLAFGRGDAAAIAPPFFVASTGGSGSTPSSNPQENATPVSLSAP